MAFFEELFPPEISAGMSGGPRFRNSKAYMLTGQRITNREAVYPLHEYSLATPPRSEALFNRLRSFFWVVGGDADAFRFRDWADYKAELSNTSTTLVSAGVYQLNRIYVYGARTFTRPIYKPVTGARIWRTRSGVQTDITATSTLDTTTGRVTVTGHVAGDTYQWVGRFDVPAAFRDPAAVFRLVNGCTDRERLEWPSIEIEEVRL